MFKQWVLGGVLVVVARPLAISGQHQITQNTCRMIAGAIMVALHGTEHQPLAPPTLPRAP